MLQAAKGDEHVYSQDFANLDYIFCVFIYSGKEFEKLFMLQAQEGAEVSGVLTVMTLGM